MYVLIFINFKQKKVLKFYFIKSKFYFITHKYKIVDGFNNEIFDSKLKELIFIKLKEHKHHIFNNQLLLSITNNYHDTNRYKYFNSSSYNFMESIEI